MAEKLEESQPRKEKKKWKALLFGVGAFLLFKGLGLLKLLVMPLLKIFGMGHLINFNDFDLVIFVQYFLIAETIFLLLFIPFTRFFKGLLILHLTLRKFYLVFLFVGWLSITANYFIDLIDATTVWWHFVIGFVMVFLVAYCFYAIEIILLHLYGRLWRVIAQKRRTI